MKINWDKTNRKHKVEEGTMRAQARQLQDSNPEKAANLNRQADDLADLRKHFNKLREQD